MNAEQKEINLITGAAAFTFRTPKKSFLKQFGKPYREWKVPYNELGIMDIQSSLFFKMKVDENLLSEERSEVVIAENLRLVRENAKLAAEVVAVSVLGSKLKIKLFRKILARYFYWRLNSQNLLQIVRNIFIINDYESFTLSIVLMNANRITNPKTPKAEAVEKED